MGSTRTSSPRCARRRRRTRRRRSTSRSSPTASRPSASRASPSTSRTATSRPRQRKFIIADTPGHVQYTRNMATGASTADVAIILIDARLGVLPQSRGTRTSRRCSGIPHLLVAVNKMDLVDFDRASLRHDSRRVRRLRAAPRVSRACTFVPISAMKGDNVVTPQRAHALVRRARRCSSTSRRCPSRAIATPSASRFPVQFVLRPHLDYRGFAGQIASGIVRKRRRASMVLPSGKTSTRQEPSTPSRASST